MQRLIEQNHSKHLMCLLLPLRLVSLLMDLVDRLHYLACTHDLQKCPGWTVKFLCFESQMYSEGTKKASFKWIEKWNNIARVKMYAVNVYLYMRNAHCCVLFFVISFLYPYKSSRLKPYKRTVDSGANHSVFYRPQRRNHLNKVEIRKVNKVLVLF